MKNFILAGVGGQGTVLASKLLAAAAINNGLDVRTTETIGMAQRGGSVVSHIRMGNSIHSPLIPMGSADLLIAFEPAEGVRLSPYLKADGLMIVCDSPIMPVTSSLSQNSYKALEMIDYLKQYIEKLTVLNGKQLIIQCGGAKTLNVALLGAAAQSGVFPFKPEELIKAIKNILPKHFVELNLNSFEIGRKIFDESKAALAN